MRKRTEHSIQVEFIRSLSLLRQKHPEVDLIFAIPNGGARDPITGGKLKAEGVKPGVPDLFLPVAQYPAEYTGDDPRWHGLFIEMKTEVGHVNANQKAWHRKLVDAGFAVIVPRSAAEAVELVRSYLDGVLTLAEGTVAGVDSRNATAG